MIFTNCSVFKAILFYLLDHLFIDRFIYFMLSSPFICIFMKDRHADRHKESRRNPSQSTTYTTVSTWHHHPDKLITEACCYEASVSHSCSFRFFFTYSIQKFTCAKPTVLQVHTKFYIYLYCPFDKFILFHVHSTSFSIWLYNLWIPAWTYILSVSQFLF